MLDLLQPYFYTQKILCILVLVLCGSIFTSSSNAKSFDTREELRKEFLLRIGKRYEDIDRFMEGQGIVDPKIKLRGLPDGEFLIFDLAIPPRLLVDGTVFAEIYKQNVVLSLKDFINTVQFPIIYDDKTQTYAGWFIREDKTFFLDITKGVVVAHGQEYKLGEASLIRDGDVYAPVESFESWFKMTMDVDIGTQHIVLNPEHSLPATERFERRQKDYKRRKTDPPKLPRYEDGYELIAMPVIDVSTRSSYKKNSGSKSTKSHSMNIRTAGEFAKGALNTNASLNNTNQLTSARFNYLQESADAEILGPAKARRFEAGDITPTRLPLTGSSPQEIGIRVTNRDPLNNIVLPSTQIAGYFFSEWDIELYRDSTLLGFQQADDEGYYNFDNIPLLPDRNVFRVVAYGPQGEVREQRLNVPYDRNRLAESGGVYDISLTVQERKLYEKTESNDQDLNTLHFVGFYEFPLSGSSALRVGGRYRQEEGANKLYTDVALSTTYRQALINAEIAADELGEVASSLS
ncbi:MAG: hypothetical protein KAJ40_07450, partial [Alphaproteobacteria bacterium]|nr:hypothetical protein [Alphaproteobacteria bacterium]